jgi:hypothetical protein
MFRNCRHMRSVVVGTMITAALFATSARADVWADRDAAVARAVEFLAKNQSPDGAFSPQTGAAVTALVVAGLLRSGRSADDPMVAKGLKYLEKFIQPDGGIYTPDGNYKNYETSLALAAFSEANKDGRYAEVMKGGEKFVRALQWDESEGKDVSDPTYGGDGYGRRSRRSAGEGGRRVAEEALQLAGEPRHGNLGPVLLLPHLRQGARRHGPRHLHR